MQLRKSLVALVLALGSAFACDNANIVASRIHTTAGGGGGAVGNSDQGGAGAAVGITAGSPPATAGGRTTSEGGEAGDGATGGLAGISTGGKTSGEAGAEAEAGSTASGGVGAGGSAGSAGDGGGGTAGGPPPSPVCDDGNGCTFDLFVEGACRNDPIPDGSRCDDADFCTLGDRCEGGRCTGGDRQSGAGTPLGKLDSLGVGAFVSVPIVTPGDDRFLFYDTMGGTSRVTLTQVVDGVFVKRGQLDLTMRMYPAVGAAWDNLAAAIDGAESIIITGSPRVLQILSVSDDGQVSERGQLPIGGSVMATMAGRGDRLFLCSNWQFFGTEATGSISWIDVSDPDAPTMVATSSLASGNTCGSIVVSEDANRVFVNTETGVLFADLSTFGTSGEFTFDANPVTVGSGLNLRGSRLLARRDSDLRLFDEATRAELAAFSVPGANSAGLVGSGIFVQGTRALGAGTEYFAALYDYSGALLDERVNGTTPYVTVLESQKAAVGVNYAFTPYNARLFQIDGGRLIDIQTPEIGSLSYLYAGPGGVHARSRLFSHRLDVSDPANPVLVAGGAHGGPMGINLDVSLAPPAMLPEHEPHNWTWFDGPGPSLVEQYGPYYPNVLSVPVVSTNADERLTASGDTLELPGGDALLLSSGDFLYRVELDSATETARLRRWLIADLRAGVREPSLDLEFQAPGETYFVSFDVDPVARVAVVATNFTLNRVDLSAEPPVVETTTLPDYVRRLRVRGNRIVYFGTTAAEPFLELITFLDLESREEATLDLALLPTAGGTIEGVLGFDGNVAYLSQGFSVVALRRGTPPTFAGEFRMRSTPTSLVEADGSLVAGSPGGVVTLSPVCD